MLNFQPKIVVIYADAGYSDPIMTYPTSDEPEAAFIEAAIRCTQLHDLNNMRVRVELYNADDVIIDHRIFEGMST